MQAQTNWENKLLDLAGKLPHPTVRPFFSDWVGDGPLHRAYRLAGRIAAAHSKTFYLASALLPADKRSAVRALYAFCRTVDDIADEVSSIRDRKLALQYWRQIVQSLLPAGNDLVAAAWIDTLNRYQIPRPFALQLIDGVARDLSQTRYRTFEELATYCYSVASTVGLMSMYVIGFQSAEAVPYAIKLGVALQMTNILRDVGEDFRNGRLYLPREELVSYGIGNADIAAGRVTKRWRQFMRFQIERTRRLYDESWPGVRMLEREGRLAIAAASTLYRAILDEIEKDDYDVFTRRAGLSRWQKLSRLPAIWLQVRSL